MAELHIAGRGMARDDVRAYMWLTLASASGEKDAAKQLDLLAARLSPEDREKGQELAKNWKPSSK